MIATSSSSDCMTFDNYTGTVPFFFTHYVTKERKKHKTEDSLRKESSFVFFSKKGGTPYSLLYKVYDDDAFVPTSSNNHIDKHGHRLFKVSIAFLFPTKNE